jgi:cardiolipin synthase
MTVLTAANQLTLLRLLLVPVFAICIIYGLLGWALATFAVASATDLLDGLIARRTGATTLGAWLDPMADKLLLDTMLVLLSVRELAPVARVPMWLTVLVISRDVAIVLTVAVVNLAVARRTFRPSWLGKAATVSYIVTGVIALLLNYLGTPSAWFTAAVWTSFTLTLLSGFEYLYLQLTSHN